MLEIRVEDYALAIHPERTRPLLEWIEWVAKKYPDLRIERYREASTMETVFLFHLDTPVEEELLQLCPKILQNA